MTTPPKHKPMVLTERQALVLQTLREHGAMHITQLSQHARLTRHAATTEAVSSLVEHLMITLDKQPNGQRSGPHLRVYSITMLGTRTLGAHKRRLATLQSKQGLLQGPRYNIFENNYVVPEGTYYRNNGNRHIPSLGVGC